MMISKEITAFKKDRTSVLVLLDIIFLILPGIAIIYLYNIELYKSLGWIKVVLLALSITTPLAFLNAMFFEVIAKEEQKTEFLIYFTSSVIFTGLILYAVVIVYHFAGRSLNEGAIFIGLIELLLIFTALYRDIKGKRDDKKINK